MHIPRYLVPFHPKRLPHRFTDVLIIGGGLAGMRAAISVDPSLSVMIATKNDVRESNSNYAQGGIASVLDPDDRFESHVKDTLIAGAALCDEQVVTMVVEEAPRRIEELIRFGTHFDKENGELILGKEGGHSHHRVVHALGDATGAEVMRAVIDHVNRLTNVEVHPNTFILDLLTHDGECVGALACDQAGQMSLIWAKQTILCTGGAGQIFRESTNPEVATADGHAIALRAGVESRDMEFVQFHPTVLYIAGSSRSLITEAIRGEGAWLVDKDGKRFMSEYDARLELAPRDIVSQSIVTQMEKTKHPCVYLDLSHLDAKYVKQRFPGIDKACAKFGLDITSDRIPVRPGAHYMIGGVTVDHQGRTSLPRLWAAGEVTSSGLHGANRLASNSLLEGLVYGAHAGEAASREALNMPSEFRAAPIENPVIPDSEISLDINDIRNALKSLMWHACGVRRSREPLTEAVSNVKNWQSYVLTRQFNHLEGWELQNMLTVSETMIQAALKREESRGVHLRMDFPAVDNEHWKKHICFRAEKTYLTPL
jgi:L-aspartate oxidase